MVFVGFLRCGFGAVGFSSDVSHMMGNRRGLAWGDIFGVGIKPEREGGHLKAIPSLGESSNTSKELTISMADAIYAMDLGRLSGVE